MLEMTPARRFFPKLQLIEDRFCIYQKRQRAGREKNRVITDYLQGIDMKEFGGAPEGDR